MKVSIVIGFKDWGAERISGAVQSLLHSVASLDAEVIVSDYGSSDTEEVKSSVSKLGAQYVYTPTDGVWSRSRALNAGLRCASGDILVTTDADMVFSPDAFPVIVEHFQSDDNQFVLMQCRDLPEGLTHEDVNQGHVTWQELRDRSTLRPRWGMGGMIAFPRWAYLQSRGLDERMEIYGGEDIDYATRMRRLGLRMSWIDDDRALMCHVWHPSSRNLADRTPAGRKAIALNRSIQLSDKSSMRNLVDWKFSPEVNPPLVSIVISTFNRSEYLDDCILSVFAQTMRDWELIIVDDGSTDNTEQVVEKYQDSRVRYYKQENQGLAVARNWGTELARGKYIAVHDDDDLMLPWRLAESLAAITEGASGAYGGWIDFDSATGKRKFNPGKVASLGSLLFSGSVYLHPTLLLETRVMKSVSYDPTLRSGSDYNLAIRLQRAGIKLNHCGNYVTMRRLHEGQITNIDPEIQKTAGSLSSVFGRSLMTWADVRKSREDRTALDKAPIRAQREIEPTILQYLPDSTVTRSAVVDVSPGSRVSPATEAVLNGGLGCTLRRLDGSSVIRRVQLADLELHQLFQLLADRAVIVDVETAPLFPEGHMTIAPYHRIDSAEGPLDVPGLIHQFMLELDSAGRSVAAISGDHFQDIRREIVENPGIELIDVMASTGMRSGAEIKIYIVSVNSEEDLFPLVESRAQQGDDSFRISIYTEVV